MTTQSNALDATWSPIIGTLNEEETLRVAELAVSRLSLVFGQGCTLKLDDNPSSTVIPNTSRGRYVGKRWLRTVKQVDLTKKGGYSIIGDYVRMNTLGKQPMGTPIVFAERQNGVQRGAVLLARAGAVADVFEDQSVVVVGAVRVAYCEPGRGSVVDNNFISNAYIPAGPSGVAPTIPPHLRVDPWGVIIDTLLRLGVSTA